MKLTFKNLNPVMISYDPKAAVIKEVAEMKQVMKDSVIIEQTKAQIKFMQDKLNIIEAQKDPAQNIVNMIVQKYEEEIKSFYHALTEDLKEEIKDTIINEEFMQHMETLFDNNIFATQKLESKANTLALYMCEAITNMFKKSFKINIHA